MRKVFGKNGIDCMDYADGYDYADKGYTRTNPRLDTIGIFNPSAYKKDLP